MNTHTKTLIFVIGVLLGIVCGEVSVWSSEVAMFAAGLVVIQSVIYFLGERGERKRKQTSDAIGITRLFSFSLVMILFSLGLGIGIIRVQLVEEKIKYTCEGVCIFTAKIVSSPETKNEYQIFKAHVLDEDKMNNGGDMYDIQVRTSLYPKYERGETLIFSGKVTIPKVIFPHSDTTGNNRAFDYASYLRTKNVGSEMVYPHVEVVDTEAHTIVDILDRWKENLVMRIDSYVSQPASSLASGMLFGASSMSSDLLQTFRIVGLSHIIVLSGFNIVIVIASILFVLAFLPLVLRITVASISVIVFVVMVGGTPSVIRATLMAFIALLAMFIGRAYVARQALILSLLVIVIYEPQALITDVSLHLSFLATMGLVYMSEPLEIFLKKYIVRISSSSLRELLVTTLSAYFVTLPYVMYTFGTVSVYALIANILVVPFVPFAMLVSFLVVVSSYLSSTLAFVFGFVDTILITFIIRIAQVIESLPFSTFTLTISFEEMYLMYIFILVSIKYISVKQNAHFKIATRALEDETLVTTRNRNLTDILSY